MCGYDNSKNAFVKRLGGLRSQRTIPRWIKAERAGIGGQRCISHSTACVRGIVVAFIIICLLNAGVVEAETTEPLKVFVLNSYHRGYDWSDRIMDAVKSEFDKTGLHVEFYIEYMDSQRYKDEQTYFFTRQLLEAKYQDVRFDVIISLDDMALYFLRDNRDDLFPGVPIVFCGVQKDDNIALGQRDKSITGVVELYDYESTVKIALKLHPSTTQIALISENLLVDFDKRTGLIGIVGKLDERIKLIDLSLWDLTMAELIEQVQQLTDGSIVLYDSAVKDSQGKLYTLEYSLRTIHKHCAVPIYITGFRKLGLGPVGGKITDGAYQGKVAAQMAIRILNGESPDNIPVQTESPNTYMFDYIQLRRFGISVSGLPEGSIIIREPQSFYYQYKGWIWSITAIISVLTLVVLLLSANILRREKAEKALRESEEKYRTLIDTIPHGIQEIDTSGVIVFANTAYLRMLGRERDEILGKYIWDLLADDSQKEELRSYLKQLVESHPARTPYFQQNLTKDGRVIDVQVGWNYKRDEKGAVIGFISVLTDITMRKKAEDELRESEQRFRAIFDNATDGILLAEPETKKFSTGNKMICQMLGYDLDELKNLSIKDIHPQEHSAYVTEQFEKQARGEIALAKDIPLKRKDGTVFYADVNSAPVKLGGKSYLMGLFRDITERKRAEETLQQAHDELEIRVKRRTAELARVNKRLRSLASELSLAEEHARRRMATDIHDHVSQKLAISKMKLESLAELVRSSKVAKALQEISDLVAQTIKSTRSLTFELSPPVLYELGFEAALEWLTKQTRQQHGLSTEFTDDGRAKPLDDDVRILLFQAVRELLVNVVKHSKAKNVAVSTRRLGSEVQVSVEDDGVGFDTSVASSANYSTSGFGLFSIHQRLGHIGGHLDIESKPGQGTRISLVAPINHIGKKAKGEPDE